MNATLPHLVRDSKGTLWIDDTGHRILDLAAEHLAHGWSAEILQENHPDLSLAQIHAALAWFYDHEEQMRQEMHHRAKRSAKLLTEIREGPLQQRLREIKASRC